MEEILASLLVRLSNSSSTEPPVDTSYVGAVHAGASCAAGMPYAAFVASHLLHSSLPVSKLSIEAEMMVHSVSMRSQMCSHSVKQQHSMEMS